MLLILCWCQAGSRQGTETPRGPGRGLEGPQPISGRPGGQRPVRSCCRGPAASHLAPAGGPCAAAGHQGPESGDLLGAHEQGEGPAGTSEHLVCRPSPALTAHRPQRAWLPQSAFIPPGRTLTWNHTGSGDAGKCSSQLSPGRPGAHQPPLIKDRMLHVTVHVSGETAPVNRDHMVNSSRYVSSSWDEG